MYHRRSREIDHRVNWYRIAATHHRPTPSRCNVRGTACSICPPPPPAYEHHHYVRQDRGAYSGQHHVLTKALHCSPIARSNPRLKSAYGAARPSPDGAVRAGHAVYAKVDLHGEISLLRRIADGRCRPCLSRTRSSAPLETALLPV